MTIKEDMKTILETLAKAKRDEVGNAWLTGPQVQDATGLAPPEINDAVEVLVGQGLVQWIQWLGTVPFAFGQAQITPRGRYAIV
jgi:hypothetical protein